MVPIMKNSISYNVVEDFPSDGVRFIDLTPSIIDSTIRNNLLNNIVNFIKANYKDIDYIICPDARGFLWGMGVATKLDCDLIPVRKTGKLPKECTSNSINYGTEYSITSLDLPIVDLVNKRVFFIDDVYATGGTYRACQQLVDLSGGELIGGAVVYDVGLDDTEIYSISRGDL